MNKERFESLRSLSPMEAVQAWLDGKFGIGDELALTEAIRNDPQVLLTDDEIIVAMCDAMDQGLDAPGCLAHLTDSTGNEVSTADRS